jgi:hypothetical protein
LWLLGVQLARVSDIEALQSSLSKLDSKIAVVSEIILRATVGSSTRVPCRKIDQALDELVRIKVREARFRDTSESTHMSAPVRPKPPLRPFPAHVWQTSTPSHTGMHARARARNTHTPARTDARPPVCDARAHRDSRCVVHPRKRPCQIEADCTVPRRRAALEPRPVTASFRI